MRFKRVMLINPRYKGHYPAFLAAGIGYVAESLWQGGIQYDYVDMGLDRSFSKLRKRIQTFSPDLIGFQVMSYRFLHTFDLIRLVERSFPQIKIVVGGHHVSLMREQVLEQNAFIDYGIVLEGEQTIIELCNGELPLSGVKGIIFREDGRVIYTGDRRFIEDIDAIPFPKYEKFELRRYPSSTIPLTSSRGCPHNYIFCPVKLAIGRQMRVRSPKNVVDEIEYWYRLGYRRFGFTDDNFTLYKDRVLEICDEVERRELENLDLVCGNGIRADNVDRQVLTKMRHVGFSWLAFGVEAGNNKILKRIKKGESIEAIEEAISDACDLGFDVDLFFLIGSPGETEADIHDSIELALRYDISSVEFYNVIPFPKTELFEWVKKNDYLLRTPEEYLNNASHWVNEPLFETPELPVAARRRIFRICQEVRKKVRKAYMQRKLAKYGIFADLLSNIYTTEIVQQRVLSNTRLKKLAKMLYTRMTYDKNCK